MTGDRHRFVLRVLRYLWASPATLLGLVVALAARAGGATWRRKDGTLEVAGGALPRLVAEFPRRMRFAAITFGHVIVGLDHADLARLRTHERVHVAQYERLGPLFIPCYLAASVAAWWRGEDPYAGNRFEQAAFAVEGATRMRARSRPARPA